MLYQYSGHLYLHAFALRAFVYSQVLGAIGPSGLFYIL